MTCGKEVEPKRYGGVCEPGHNVVHQRKCCGCNNIIGYILEDDYIFVEKCYCSECINKIKNENN